MFFPGTVLPKCAAFFREQYFQNALRFSGNSTSKMRCVFSGKVGGAYRVIIELQSGNLRVNFFKKIILILKQIIIILYLEMIIILIKLVLIQTLKE